MRTLAHWFLVITWSLLLGPWSFRSAAASVLITWWANPEPDITCYIVHIGTNSRSYTTITNVGNITNWQSAPLSPMTYYAMVTAVNTSGLESDPSNEVSWTIPAPATKMILQVTVLEHPLVDAPGQPVITYYLTNPIPTNTQAYFSTTNRLRFIP